MDSTVKEKELHGTLAGIVRLLQKAAHEICSQADRQGWMSPLQGLERVC